MNFIIFFFIFFSFDRLSFHEMILEGNESVRFRNFPYVSGKTTTVPRSPRRKPFYENFSRLPRITLVPDEYCEP